MISHAPFLSVSFAFWIHLLQHNIGSHTSHNIAHYNLSEIDISMRQKRCDVCVKQDIFQALFTHNNFFPFPPLKCKNFSVKHVQIHNFYEIIQCTKFAKLWILLENLILVIHNSCRRLFILRLECTGGGWEQ